MDNLVLDDVDLEASFFEPTMHDDLLHDDALLDPCDTISYVAIIVSHDDDIMLDCMCSIHDGIRIDEFFHLMEGISHCFMRHKWAFFSYQYHNLY